MSSSLKIAVAPGDGIGPEIMNAVLRVFKSADVPLEYEMVEMGKSIYDRGFPTGITPEAQKAIETYGILFKGPMETPKGGGVKSINVTARKVYNTYANVRRFISIPGVDTVFSKAGIPINMTILRENIEDTYGGVEYMQCEGTAVGYRFATAGGLEQFLRFCFDYVREQGLKKITCGHKANIMKVTDGLFLKIFYEIAKEYPDLECNDLIVDDLAMKLVRHPDKFEVIALTNLQGDILSDLCAGLVGGLGFAPSANVGDAISIFEAVHGTAPDIAGKGIANPTSLLLSGIMMLHHLGLHSQGDMIQNALMRALEEGVHTGDFGTNQSPTLGTEKFVDEIIARLGQSPTQSAISATAKGVTNSIPTYHAPEVPSKQKMRSYGESAQASKVDGVDLFVDSKLYPAELSHLIEPQLMPGVKLLLISNRGTQVFPTGSIFTELVPHHMIRLVSDDESMDISQWYQQVSEISKLVQVSNVALLRTWGELRGYSLAQGQK